MPYKRVDKLAEFPCPSCPKAFRTSGALQRHRTLTQACLDAYNTYLRAKMDQTFIDETPSTLNTPANTENEDPAPLQHDDGSHHENSSVTHDDPVYVGTFAQETLAGTPEHHPNDGAQPEQADQPTDPMREASIQNIVTDMFPGAAEVKGRVTPFFASILKQQEDRGGQNLYYPFAGSMDWGMARSFTDAHLPMTKIDEILGNEYIKARPLSFGTGTTLRERIAMLPDTRLRWLSQQIIPEYGNNGQPVTLFYRNPVDAIRSLLDCPSLAAHLEFVPRRLWRNEARQNRVYDEIFTGNWAWETQEELPAGGTLIPVILGSDKAHLTILAGDKEAWPLYLSIGNIKSNVRNKASNRAWVLMGYIPCGSFSTDDARIRTTLQSRLFHQCLKIILRPLVAAGTDGIMTEDSIGDQRLCFPRVASYLADYPEQLLINCAAGNNSPITTASFPELGSPTILPPRTREWILDRMRRVSESVDPTEVFKYQEAARKLGLNGVHKPFWENLPGYRPELCIAPDILHGLLKFWRDHILHWVRELVGEEELDARLRVLQPIIGMRHFKDGVSHLSQWTGRDDRELQRVLLAVIADAPKIDPRVTRCLRAFHDFSYFAQYRIHSDSTIQYLEKTLAAFHFDKNVFIENGARTAKGGKKRKRKKTPDKDVSVEAGARTAKGGKKKKEKAKKVIKHFNIPKMAGLHGYAFHIPWMGTSPQFSTEITENCHQTLVKEPYHLTNFKEFENQMCRSLDRDERVQQMQEFLLWAVMEYRRCSLEAEMESHSKSYRELALKYLGRSELGVEIPAPSAIPKARLFHTLTPHHREVQILDVARQYKLIDLPTLISAFLRKGVPSDPAPMQPKNVIDVWKNFRIQLPTVQCANELAEARTVMALPPSKEMRYGLCNCVLVKRSKRVEEVRIKGHRVAQVRLVFRLWFEHNHPLHLTPLAYVQWFSRPKKLPEADIRMYEVKRLHQDGRHRGGIIELSSVARLVQLIPRFGASVAPELNLYNTMELCKRFYVNPFVDRETHLSVY